MDLPPDVIGARTDIGFARWRPTRIVLAGRLAEVTGQDPASFPAEVLEMMIRIMRRDLRSARKIVYDRPALLDLHARAGGRVMSEARVDRCRSRRASSTAVSTRHCSVDEGDPVEDRLGDVDVRVHRTADRGPPRLDAGELGRRCKIGRRACTRTIRKWVVDFCVAQSKAGVDHEADYRAMTKDGKYIWIRDVVRRSRRRRKRCRSSGSCSTSASESAPRSSS